jgi:hypothetical protein
VILAVCSTVIVPPYCGVPRLSHQFPVAVMVVLAFVDMVAVVVMTVVVSSRVVTGVAEGLFITEDPHDAKINDVMTRIVGNAQKILFFINPPVQTQIMAEIN